MNHKAINIDIYKNKNEDYYIEQFSIQKRMCRGLINQADNNYDLCNVLYAYGIAFGPEYMWEHYKDLIISFWGDFKDDYSPYAEYSNYIEYHQNKY